MTEKIALLTNATQYAGPAALIGLLADGWTVACHDRTFGDKAAREAFEREHSGTVAFTETETAAFARSALDRFGRVDCLVSNDYPADALPMSAIENKLDHFEALVDNLLLEPVRVLREVIGPMRQAGRGSIILVTSGAPLRNPGQGGAHGYSAARAGANKLAQTLAAQLAPDGIRVNAVAPFYLHSQFFFPTEIGLDDPAYSDMLSQVIPMNRFGRPEELSGLFALLADPDSPFLTAQVIAFSGAGC